MRLAQLLRDVDSAEVHGTSDVDLHRITRDSREAGDGVIWVAIRGANFDGHDVAAQIPGGVAVLERPLDVAAGVTRVVVPSTRLALAQLSAALHGHPATRLPAVGVTGTNGKTTVTSLCAGAMAALSRKVGRIGTLGAAWGERQVSTGLTTPEPTQLHSLLADMEQAGSQAVFLEVSSIALDQQRVEALPFHTVVFTNLSRDHLDFHGTMDAYAASKAQLFAEHRLRPAGGAPRAILCADDPAWPTMNPPEDRWLYGTHPDCDLWLESIKPGRDGQQVRVRLPDGSRVSLRSHLVGGFNALNQVAALAVLRTVGLTWEQGVEALGRVRAVPGRLEPVPNNRGVRVYVDYAHTPDAVAAALGSLRPLTGGQLWVVFGCGGDRDPGKRPEMGRVAVAGADRVVVTSDNPRSEDPLQIIDQIVEVIADQVSDRVHVQLDRREAIRYALVRAAPGDVVLIAGKGHEVTQEIAGSKHAFDDRIVAEEVQ